MARAGFCRSCGTNVWLLEDGSGACGHPATDIEGVYEAGEAGAEPASSLTGAASAAMPAGTGDSMASAAGTMPAADSASSVPPAQTGRSRLFAFLGSLAALALLIAGLVFLTRPQLTVTRLVTGGAVEQSEPAKAIVTVSNEGKRTGSTEIVLVVNGEEVGRGEVTVEPGATKDAEIEFCLDEDPGDYVMVAKGFDVAEDIHVLEPAALEVVSVTAEPRVLHAGIDERGTCVATVENAGEAEGDLEVQFTLDGKPLGSDSVTVSGGSENEATFEFDVPGAGKHVLDANGVTASFFVHRISRPANGAIVVNKLKGGSNRIKMVNNQPTDILVVLSQPGDGKPALLAVYLRSKGSRVISGVKDGTYQVYYSFGSDWCPTCKEFESGRYDGRFETVDKLKSTRSTYTQLTLTFGNAPRSSPTEDVGADQFPKM